MGNTQQTLHSPKLKKKARETASKNIDNNNTRKEIETTPSRQQKGGKWKSKKGKVSKEPDRKSLPPLPEKDYLKADVAAEDNQTKNISTLSVDSVYDMFKTEDENAVSKTDTRLRRSNTGSFRNERNDNESGFRRRAKTASFSRERSRPRTESNGDLNGGTRVRSKSLTVLKNKDKKMFPDDQGVVKRRTTPRTNSEYDIMKRRSLPTQLQKQLRKKSILSHNPLFSQNDYRTLKVPFLFPLNRKLMVKLIPIRSTEDRNYRGNKHVLFVCVKTQDQRDIAKTGQLYKASLLFTEGCLKKVRDRNTGVTQDRLTRAQIWTGLSQSVDFENEMVRIMGNFMSRAKGMIEYLEFVLELKPNFRNIDSEDTGKTLFSVGSFTLKDSRSVQNKSMQWHAVIENWKTSQDADDLGWSEHEPENDDGSTGI